MPSTTTADPIAQEILKSFDPKELRLMEERGNELLARGAPPSIRNALMKFVPACATLSSAIHAETAKARAKAAAEQGKNGQMTIEQAVKENGKSK